MTAQCGDKNSKELQTEQDALQTLRKKRKLSKMPQTLGNVKPQVHVNVHT